MEQCQCLASGLVVRQSTRVMWATLWWVSRLGNAWEKESGVEVLLPAEVSEIYNIFVYVYYSIFISLWGLFRNYIDSIYMSHHIF